MDFQFIYDRRLNTHSIDCGSEYQVLNAFFNDELASGTMTVAMLTDLQRYISLNKHYLGQVWSLNIEGDDIIVYHNSCADALDKICSIDDSAEDADLEQEEQASMDTEIGLTLSTNEHVLQCGKDDLLYLIDKWIQFIQE